MALGSRGAGMPVRLGALLGQRALGLTALTDADPGREISWVHASELADPTPYLDGGELLLSVGMWLEPAAAPQQASAYVRRLVEAGVVGLGFGVGVQHAEVPTALVAAAAAAGLPLLQVPEQTAFVAVGRSVWEALAAEQYAEVTRTSSAQQELTRAAVASGTAGLLRRLAERLDGWALLLDAGGAVSQAAPAGAGRRGAWLATELERFRDLSTPVSATLSVEDDQIAVQSLRLGRHTRGFLAVGSPQRLNREQRTVVNTAASLLTLMLAQTTALRVAESQLRTAVVELLVDGEPARASKLAAGLWGGLPADPVRLLLAIGTSDSRDDLAELLDRSTGIRGRTRTAPADRVLHAELADRLAVVYPAAGRLRGRVLAAATGTAGVVAGESTEAGSAELGRALREAEQALAAGIRSGARLTCFADIGASGLLSLLSGPSAGAFAESLLRPLIEHDRSGRGDLVRSLATWLEHNGEWDAAATALGVHRHTLRHRIRRTAELLGRDLDAAAVRAELWIALRLLDGTAAPPAAPARPAGPTGRTGGPERRLVR
jgi:PucR family transcriptional regulator, purine catabolism regulatory protein